MLKKERVNSPGSIRQGKKYRETTKERNCIVTHTTSQKSSMHGYVFVSNYSTHSVVVVDK